VSYYSPNDEKTGAGDMRHWPAALAKIGTWAHDIRTGTTVWNEEAFQIYELDTEEHRILKSSERLYAMRPPPTKECHTAGTKRKSVHLRMFPLRHRKKHKMAARFL
jgi:hypothetical protein